MPAPPAHNGARSPTELALGALPGEHAEQAGLVDALDDPGPAAAYSPDGFARITRLARELGWLRTRADAPLTDLVADVERVLLLDAETAARPGPVGRAHLDAFADVVADFAAGAEVATLPALLDYLQTAEQAEDGFTARRGRGHARPRPGAHGARREGPGVGGRGGAAPGGAGVPRPQDRRHVAHQPGRAARRPARRRPRPAPTSSCPTDGDRRACENAVKAHSEALDARRLVEERRLFYVALTRAERVLLLSGHRWPATGEKPRLPSEFLVEAAEAHGAAGLGRRAGRRRRQPGHPGAAHRALARRPARRPRPPTSSAGAELVRAALRARIDARDARAAATDPGAQLPLLDLEPPPEPDEEDPEGWAADVDVLLAERAAARARPAVELPTQLTVSRLVELAADPAGLAARLRRPLPLPPNPHARRGTAFHAWLEQRFGAAQLLDLDELPGAADEGAASDDALEALQEAFLASDVGRAAARSRSRCRSRR